MSSLSPWPVAPSALWALSVLLALLASGIGWLGLAPAASATDYTWSGGGFSADAWSNGANWVGGVAPSAGSAIGTLTLPKLSSTSVSTNDLTGLSIEHLVADDSQGYSIGGDGLTLGSGGLTLSAAEAAQLFAFILSTPLNLAGSQTWTVSGPSGSFLDIELSGALSGENADLTINLNSLTRLVFGDLFKATNLDDELGNVTINGTEVVKGEVQYDSIVTLPNSFNATDGHSLTLHKVQVEGLHTATGPITAVKSNVSLEGPNIGAIASTESGVYLNGQVVSLSLDNTSTLGFGLDGGSTPGTDYNQVTSGGTINLGGSQLELGFQNAESTCPPPPVGQVYPLVTTTGSLSGSFGNVPDGGTVTADCIAVEHGEPSIGRVYSYGINYHTSSSPQTVTATVLPAVPVSIAEVPPTIGGSAVAGQTLSLTHGHWNNGPTSYSDQWERCDTAGGNCQPITGATGQTYSLTTADVGATIRVMETASNGEGTSEPAMSAPTAAVQSAPLSKELSSGGGLPLVACCDGPPLPVISVAQLQALLARQLIPTGKAATIAALLKRGGYTFNFTAPEAGSLSVQWYELPKGATLAKRGKPQPVLVASGKRVFSGAMSGKLRLTLTGQGKKLLRGARRVKLATKGSFTPLNGAVTRVTRAFALKS